MYAAEALPPAPRRAVVDDSPDPAFLLRLRALLLSLGPGALACGPTAAAVRGWAQLHEPGRTEVAVDGDRGRTTASGGRVRRARGLGAGTGIALDDLAAVLVTTAVATVLHCVAGLPRLEGVVLVDSALCSGQVTLDELHAAARSLPGRRRVARTRAVLALADPLAGSVLESVLRYRLVQAGITGFQVQQVLRSAGAYLLRVDFCFPGARLVVEVDGRRFHTDTARDQSLDNALAAEGWRVLRYGWHDVVHRPEVVVAQIRAALAAQAAA